jgi:hypothetical protein
MFARPEPTRVEHLTPLIFALTHKHYERLGRLSKDKFPCSLYTMKKYEEIDAF